jgi:peptidoglycan/LPS O-acetylase OafA/YrhL
VGPSGGSTFADDTRGSGDGSVAVTETSEPVPGGGPSATGASARLGRIPALDGLRGLAVALVVAYHFAPTWFPAGFLGVDVFFVLSGFLITSLALGEHHRTADVSVRDFYVRRARRLLPAAIVTIVATVAVAAVLQPTSARGTTRGQAVASLLYGANWWSIVRNDSYQATFGAESPLSHFWSLAVEEQFYLVFPLVLAGLVVLARRRGAPTRSIALGLLATSTVVALASAGWMAALHDPSADPSRLYFGTDTRIQAPLLGVAAACAWWLWSDRIRRGAPARWLAGAAPVALVALLGAALVAGLRDSWLYHYGFLAVALGTAALVLAVVAGRTPLTRVLEHRWLCLLGLVSYSVYLVHWPVRVFVTADSTPFDGIGLLVVRLLLTAALAALSFLLVERPFRRATHRPTVALSSVAGLLVAVALVWVVARPVAPPAGTLSRDLAPVTAAADTSAAADATPTAPLRVLWLGDSVAWTIGGGHLDFPQPVAFDNPFDPARIVIWNKADYSCPLVATPKRIMGIVKEKTGWCVHKDTEWPKLLDQFPADVVLWSATMFDVSDNRVDGRWITFATPEWDQLYLDNLEAARAIATSRGARFVLLGQADPVPNPDEADQESLLPQNVWRWGHLRDLQRTFADEHPADTRFVDLQPIVCPGDSCASLTPDHPGLRSDGVHFLSGAVAPLVPQIQAALEQAAGRAA